MPCFGFECNWLKQRPRHYHGEGIQRPGYLYALDFDQTITEDDSELALTQVLGEPLPDTLINMYNGENYAEFCEALIDYTLAKKSVTLDVILRHVRRLEPLQGMRTLLPTIQRATRMNHKSHFLVISGANELFIKEFLAAMEPPVKPNAIISNHAQIVGSGNLSRLKFEAFERQRGCALCPPFLCKGNALQGYINQHGPFKQVYYCGDGQNDVCPAQRLGKNDILFVRQGFDLDHAIRFGYYGGRPISIKAKIVYFKTARTIQKIMKLK